MTIDIDILDTQHSDLDDVFRHHAFQALWTSGAMQVDEVLLTSPSGPESSQRTLDALVERGMAVVEGDELVGIDGLSTRPTRHRMRLRGHDLFTWCAADAVGIPAALAEDADVATACPHCSAQVTVTIRTGAVVADPNIVLWLPTGSCSHVVTQFCPDVNFFCNSDHLDKWRSQADHPQGERLTLDGAADLGRRWWGYLKRESRS